MFVVQNVVTILCVCMCISILNELFYGGFGTVSSQFLLTLCSTHTIHLAIISTQIRVQTLISALVGKDRFFS